MANYTYPNIPAQLNPGDIVFVRYTGSVVTWKPSNNGVTKMKVECWGAAGASSGSIIGGSGGYTAGTIEVGEKTIYILSGQQGMASGSAVGGGGLYGGGGCTWIASVSNPTQKSHLYTVASGGGGYSPIGTNEQGGHGGGLVGFCGPVNKSTLEKTIGGTQTSGGYTPSSHSSGSGTSGSFLKGGNGRSQSEGSGGGAGLYGGGGTWCGGGGGSSYIDGLIDGETHDGSTGYGNRGNGYIRILILEDSTIINVTVKDKKPVYHAPEPVIFTVNSNKSIARLDVMFEDLVIKSFQNPTIDDSVEYTVEVSHELFLSGSNGTNYVKWVCYDANDIELHTHVEKYNKYSNDMTIITEPILIAGPELAVDLNIDLKYIEHNDNIKIFVCNNAYDDTPTWEDVTARILNKLNILTTNRKKTNENWGLSFKIEVTGPFELSEDFIGGFYVHGFDTPPTLAPEQQDEPNVYRNTPWGTYLHKQASMETEKEILLMELSEDIGVLSGEEKNMDHYKELYEKGFITETQFNRIMKINK